MRALDQRRRLVHRAGSQLVVLTTPCFRPAEGPARDLARLADGQRVRRFNAVLGDFARTHPAEVSLVDLYRLTCPGGRYLGSIDGVPQRIDGVHLTPDAAQNLWRLITPEIQAAFAG